MHIVHHRACVPCYFFGIHTVRWVQSRNINGSLNAKCHVLKKNNKTKRNPKTEKIWTLNFRQNEGRELDIKKAKPIPNEDREQDLDIDLQVLSWLASHRTAKSHLVVDIDHQQTPYVFVRFKILTHHSWWYTLHTTALHTRST